MPLLMEYFLCVFALLVQNKRLGKSFGGKWVPGSIVVMCGQVRKDFNVYPELYDDVTSDGSCSEARHGLEKACIDLGKFWFSPSLFCAPSPAREYF